MIDRDSLDFRYFLETEGEGTVDGSDVYRVDPMGGETYLGRIFHVRPSDIHLLSDDELEEAIRRVMGS